MIWKDTTTRSQQDPDRPASCWTLDTGKVRITVMNSHRDDPGEWVFTCHEIGVKAKRIGCKQTDPAITARHAALDFVRKQLKAMLESLGG